MSRATRSAAVGLAWALVASVPGPAAAFRLIEAHGGQGTHCSGWYLTCEDEGPFLRWHEYVVPYRVNADAALDAGSALSQADIIQAMQLSFQAWEDAPDAIIRFAYAGETAARIQGLDGVNTTLWFATEHDFFTLCLPGELQNDGGHAGWFARTIITESSGEIIDVDVVCNTYPGYTWEWNPQAPSCAEDVLDLQGVLTHEYGHFIGIDHSDFEPQALPQFPTMVQEWCDPGGEKRTLAPDDEAAAACLYPEMPTVILVDQSGSMAPAGKMQAAQGAANDFIEAFSNNLAAVAAFADADEGCPTRSGYALLQDWTHSAVALEGAVNSTSACGMSPLWEATCCAIDKAAENAPSNLLVFTDAAENSSNGICPCAMCCTDFDTDVLPHALASDVAVYVVDMTDYVGAAPGPQRGTSPSFDLEQLAQQTGGLYFRPASSSLLLLARLDVQRHMAEVAKDRRNPPAPPPGPFPIGTIQSYAPPGCSPSSPYAGSTVTIYGRVTVPRGTFDSLTQWVEDRTGGIPCIGDVVPIGAIGDSVSVTGLVSTSGDIRIDMVVSYSILSAGTLPGLPTVEPYRALLCEAIGRLIKVRGYVTSIVAGGSFLISHTVPDGTGGGVTVSVDPQTGIDTSGLQVGDVVRVVGVVAPGAVANQIQPRTQSDLEIVTAVEAEEIVGASGQPTGVRSVQPNPSSGEVRIIYALSKPGRARLRIFDAQGRLVRSLVDGSVEADRHSVRWDGRNAEGAPCASGVYFLRFEAPEGHSESERVTLLR